ncbi:MAG TPA: ABC-2 family transporter protein [Symbiobacteriaceae bacterium]|nr:ABC-2 family transporter protein [Symbiobacteriaceae bacterium]
MVYLQVGRSGYLRNVAYKWSHMLNNLTSAIFGFIYIALWQAVAPEHSATDLYTRATMTDMMVLAQTFAWVSVFLPAGLGIQNSVRSGAIALEMARPVPFFPMVVAREGGNLAYQVMYRSFPLAVVFAVTVGFPRPGSAASLLLTVPSLMLAGYIALCLVYTVGMTALWTTEVRWAQWTYYSLTTLLSGGWIPPDILPGFFGKVVPYLPFAAQISYPARIYLGWYGWPHLLVQAAWAAVATLWCQWLTRRGLQRVVVQGG